MKRIVFVFLFLALALAACGPAPTPVVITVVATNEPVVATNPPAPTEAPAPTDEPAATEAPAPTDEPAATEAPEPTDEPGVAPTNTRPPAVGGDVFVDLTRDVDAFSLKCSPSELHFTVKSINKAITGVTLYYRVTDKDATSAAGGLITGPEMVGDKKGNFTLTFSALDIKDDLRLANGWFDYQFVGVNKFGDVVGRSDKIVKEVTFTLDCP
jgi:hypothetical protein